MAAALLHHGSAVCAWAPRGASLAAGTSRRPAAAAAPLAGPTTCRYSSSQSVVQRVVNKLPGGEAGAVGLGVGALAVVLFALKAVKGKKGSVNSLMDRGMVDEDRDGGSGGGSGDKTRDSFYANIMKDVNTTIIEELTPEQIAASRARRKAEVALYKDSVMDLDKVELPENHPWAVKEEVADTEIAKIKARLSAQTRKDSARVGKEEDADS